MKFKYNGKNIFDLRDMPKQNSDIEVDSQEWWFLLSIWAISSSRSMIKKEDTEKKEDAELKLSN